MVSSLVSFLYEDITTYEDGNSELNDAAAIRSPETFQHAVLDLVIAELYTIKEFSCLRAACNDDYNFGENSHTEFIFRRFLIPLTFQIAHHNFLGSVVSLIYIKY